MGNEQRAPDSRIAPFEATPESATAARRFVVDALAAWGCGELGDDAALVVAELAANAVLHARAPYQVALRFAGDGVRIEVIDDRPAELPAPVPQTGSASDLTALSITGRGLHIVAVLASRWGYTTSQTAKSVWAELEAGTPLSSTEPVVAIGHQVQRDPASLVHVRLLDLPVRAAVASGIQVEELVREVQLGHLANRMTDAELDRFYELLDRSASPRLAGRHAALRAAGEGRRRYDLQLSATPAELTAVAQLSELLTALPALGPAAATQPSPAVLAFRDWLQQEVTAQLRGAEPRPAPLADDEDVVSPSMPL
jgi:anti-sigma regulatory factor (Ser/Thr protein kinase)